MGNPKGGQIVGGLVTVGVGILVVAAIFQLNQNKGAGVAQDSTNIGTTALNNVFKG